MDHTDDAEFVGHEPCPECGSRDNLARYSDGHGFCFGCEHYEPGDGEPTKRKDAKRMSSDFLKGEYKPLGKRGINLETCRKFGYRIAKFKDQIVHVADYQDPQGNGVVAQKIRFKDKSFSVIGSMKEAGLFGQHLWRDSGRMVVITEGEIDALSVSQCQGNKYPVVSLNNGSGSAKKAVNRNLEWLCGFDKVVLFFDNDEPGREAAEQAAAQLPPGKAFIARMSEYKDANEALLAGKQKDIIDAIWGAKAYRPDGIVSIQDVKEEALKPTEMGLPWCFDTLTQLTYGRRPAELYAIGAGTGVGKTDLFTQQIAYDVQELGRQVGVIYLEQPVTETVKRIAGKMVGKQFHIPDAEWTTEELASAIDLMDDKVFMYDHFGETDWDVVRGHIRYMASTLGLKLIYLDHLTALADPASERESLEEVMKDMAGLAQELKVTIHFISHLSTPDGKPHEEGGRVMIRHFKGSRSIGFWSYFMFGMERDQQADDENERQTTTFRVLKDRYTGRATGKVVTLRYNQNTGMLYEAPADGPDFEDETGDDEPAF